MVEVATLEENMAAYDTVKADMEARYRLKYVVFYNRKFEGAFDTFHKAASSAVPRFGRGPYLIRKVSRRIPPLPASLWLRRAPDA